MLMLLAFLFWNRERRRCNAALARRPFVFAEACTHLERMWLGVFLILIGGSVDGLLLTTVAGVFGW
jgi:hypothetical protein